MLAVSLVVIARLTELAPQVGFSLTAQGAVRGPFALAVVPDGGTTEPKTVTNGTFDVTF